MTESKTSTTMNQVLLPDSLRMCWWDSYSCYKEAEHDQLEEYIQEVEMVQLHRGETLAKQVDLHIKDKILELYMKRHVILHTDFQAYLSLEQLHLDWLLIGQLLSGKESRSRRQAEHWPRLVRKGDRHLITALSPQLTLNVYETEPGEICIHLFVGCCQTHQYLLPHHIKGSCDGGLSLTVSENKITHTMSHNRVASTCVVTAVLQRN